MKKDFEKGYFEVIWLVQRVKGKEIWRRKYYQLKQSSIIGKIDYCYVSGLGSYSGFPNLALPCLPFPLFQEVLPGAELEQEHHFPHVA